MVRGAVDGAGGRAAIRRGRGGAQHRGPRARGPPSLRHHPQAVRHLRHGPDGPGPLQEAARAQGVRRRRGVRGGTGRAQGGRRGRGHDPHPHHRALPLLPRHRHRHGGQPGPGRRHHHEAGDAGSDGAVGPRPAHGGQGRRLGHHRAQLRLGRAGRHAVDGPARRRRVHPQRQQDLHHQWALRRHHRALRQARRRVRHPGAPTPGAHLRPGPGHPRPRAVGAVPQDGPPLLAHGRAVPLRRPGRPRPSVWARPRTNGQAVAANRPRATSSPNGPGWPPCRSD